MDADSDTVRAEVLVDPVRLTDQDRDKVGQAHLRQRRDGHRDRLILRFRSWQVAPLIHARDDNGHCRGHFFFHFPMANPTFGNNFLLRAF
jgi:hypothetical protein